MLCHDCMVHSVCIHTAYICIIYITSDTKNDYILKVDGAQAIALNCLGFARIAVIN